jgi:hypothetical protein
MKTIIIESFKRVVADRVLLILLGALILLAIIFAVIIGVMIHSSDLQLITHYSAFGISHIYRSQWFYLYVFVLFELVVAVLQTVLAVKLLVVKGRALAIMTAWSGIIIILLGFSTALSLLNLNAAWNPFQ